MDEKILDIVGKLVNRATSDNGAEADAAARGAIGRLRKAGAAFVDYVAALDPETVFQSGLVRVADAYVAGRDDLSQPGKRELYAALIRTIASKYSGPPEGDREREAEFRRRDEELRRREREASEQEKAAGKSGNAGSGSGAPGFSFSPARRFFSHPAFAVWKRDPREAFRIYAVGALFGMFAAVSGTLAAAFAFAWYGEVPGPLGEIPTVWVMSALWTFGGSVRVWAEFRPGARAFFSRFP